MGRHRPPVRETSAISDRDHQLFAQTAWNEAGKCRETFMLGRQRRGTLGGEGGLPDALKDLGQSTASGISRKRQSV